MNSSKMLEKNISQYPALELFQKLGYKYISPEDCIVHMGVFFKIFLKNN